METVQKMILDLIEAGHTATDIARSTNIPQPTITRLRQGSHADTSYTYGKRIEDFYRTCFPAAPDPS